MLFNSYEFIFVFLPVSVGCFYVFASFSHRLAFGSLILASLFFYAWWRPLNVLIIAPSMVANFVLARVLQRFAEIESRRRLSMVVLTLGIAFNVAFIGYFKYKGFLQTVSNDFLGTDFVLTEMILPLGISFITFQKIAFLIDVHAGRIQSFTLREYLLFVLFFPQLIAGPIVHYRELVPQFSQPNCRFDRANVSIGLTLFFFGLFKKVILADSIAPIVTAIYDRAAGSGGVSLFPAWMAAIGFTFQVYFDFSGYSDMALGAARLFGIRLPANFNSPLRASSIIEFWLRWHMTLTRFLTAYVYNPLVLFLTRRRLAKGRQGLVSTNPTIGSFVSLLMLPTLLTMVLSGLWHGAGYLFVIWGLLHGIYLSMNHAWRMRRSKLRRRVDLGRLSNLPSFALTFVAVITAMVFFRSQTLDSATDLLKGMSGLNGITLPASIYDTLTPIHYWLQPFGLISESWLSGTDFAMMTIWLALLTLVILVLPNTLEVLRDHEPALGLKRLSPGYSIIGKTTCWNPSLAWAILVAVMAATGILHLSRPSEFLYWQF